ncbi:MAG: Holliday junction branch migration protein RuvA [Deltaproteobacteria bacterium]|nr:MAG: Holliday junction branch migration protein RuvA [Deltaproteobacteria bacterium]
MISYLRGRLLRREPTQVVIDVGGVGYGLQIPLSTFYRLPDEGEEVELLVYTYVHNEGLSLYGFSSPKERELFEMMISVRGVGPRVALTLLSGMAAEELEEALMGGDTERLRRVPGIGKRIAERMVFELGNKVSRGKKETPEAFLQSFQDAVAALVQLGFNRTVAKGTISKVIKEKGPLAVEELLKEALRRLCKL